MQKNDMNLLESYNDLHKERSSKVPIMRVYVGILIAVFLLLGAFTIRYWIIESGLKTDIAALKEYNNNEQVKKTMAEITVLKENIKSLDQLLIDTKSITSVFSSAVRFNSKTMYALYAVRPTSMGFSAISYSDGVLSVDVRGTRASDFSNYVLRLENDGYFKKVEYFEYAFDSATRIYTATLRCVLKGGN